MNRKFYRKRMTNIPQKTDLDLWHDRMDAAIAESAAYAAKKQADEKNKTAASPPVIAIASGAVTTSEPSRYTAYDLMDDMRRTFDEPPAPLPPEPAQPPEPPPTNPFDMTGASWRRKLIDAPPDEIMATLNERRIHRNRRPEFPAPVISCRGSKIGVVGEIAIVAGKKKTGKSHVIAAMVAGYISGKKTMPLGFTGAPPKNRAGVLYFDTEMSASDVWIQHDRITRLAAISDHEMMSLVYMYHLRRFNAAERVKMIDTAIREHADDCAVVVIDGIRDLLMDINSSTESQIVLSDMLRWTDEHRVCIVTAIHYNETGDTAKMRGHLGTELGNKGFSMIETSCEPNTGYFVVKTPMSRKKRMDGDIGWFMTEYEITDDESGTLPVELDSVAYEALREANKPVNRNSRHTKTMAVEMADEAHQDLIRDVFAASPDGLLSWGDILTSLKNKFFKTTGKEIGKDRAAAYRMYWSESGMICFGAGTPRTRSARWRAATPDEITFGIPTDDDLTPSAPAPSPEPPAHQETGTTGTTKKRRTKTAKIAAAS